MIEGGIGNEHAHGGSVRVGRRDTLDEKLGLRLLRAVAVPIGMSAHTGIRRAGAGNNLLRASQQ